MPTRSRIADVADARTRQLVTVLVLALSAILVAALLVRAVLDPELVAADLPMAGLALLNFGAVLWLNRTRFHRRSRPPARRRPIDRAGGPAARADRVQPRGQRARRDAQRWQVDHQDHA